jgi:transketolase
LATRWEVLLAVHPRATLETEGIGCTVVSMPSWELFDEPIAEYRAATLGRGMRVATEGACRMGRDAYLGARGGIIGMTGLARRMCCTKSLASRLPR